MNKQEYLKFMGVQEGLDKQDTFWNNRTGITMNKEQYTKQMEAARLLKHAAGWQDYFPATVSQTIKAVGKGVSEGAKKDAQTLKNAPGEIIGTYRRQAADKLSQTARNTVDQMLPGNNTQKQLEQIRRQQGEKAGYRRGYEHARKKYEKPAQIPKGLIPSTPGLKTPQGAFMAPSDKPAAGPRRTVQTQGARADAAEAEKAKYGSNFWTDLLNMLYKLFGSKRTFATKAQ